MSLYGDIMVCAKTWLNVVIYNPVRAEILSWPISIKKDLGAILTKLQKGDTVGYPDVDQMKAVAPGCKEIRLKDAAGIFRAFYVIETDYGVLVFHGFKKKSRKTLLHEIKTGRKRLRAFLKELENEKK